VRYLSVIIPIVSNSAVCSYLAELRKIAKTNRPLSHTTLAELRNAQVLVGSQYVRSQENNQAIVHVKGDEQWGDEDQELVYGLLAPNQVAIADDTIALQQFGEDVFCAPQEDTLEGEGGNSMCPVFHINFENHSFLPIPWLQTAQ